MTLIVANCDGKKIAIVSDTALSKPDQYNRSRQWMGTLKALIISPNICICYAGIAQYAIESIRKVKAALSYLASEEILTLLLNEHLQYKEAHRPDFILAMITETGPRLHKIQNGKIEYNLATCWIGSNEAFEVYQKLFHEHRQRLQSQLFLQGIDSFTITASAMSDAMAELIDLDTDTTVGGFYVPISSKPEGFKYLSHGGYYGAKRHQVISTEWTTIEWAGKDEGGYAYSMLRPEEIGVAAIGVHIHQISLAIFFHPLELPVTYVIKDITNRQFIEYIKSEFGFTLGGVLIG